MQELAWVPDPRFQEMWRKQKLAEITQMSEGERMREYAETGDPTYLTVELARKMKVLPKVMSQVDGATPEDVRDAQIWHAEEEAFLDEDMETQLRLYGADRNSLEGKSIHEQLRSLLDVASIRVSDTGTEEGFQDEVLREEAVRRILDFVLCHQESMYRLFEVLRIDTPQGLRDIAVVEEIISELKSEYDNGNYQATGALDEVLDIARRTLAMEFHPQSNYLSAERLYQFLQTESGPGPIKSDVDMYVPFEITEGVYAVFSSDSDRIHIADDDLSKDIKAIVRTGWSSEYMSEEGHDIPSYKYEYIPEDLTYVVDNVLDTGTSLDEMALEIGISDPDIVKDYITVLRSSSREIIETKFGFRLTKLSIKEQLFFLNYLKQTTVASAESMQQFTKTYGVNGLRAFLANAYDESAAENLVTMGTVLDTKSVQGVFESYASSIDNAQLLTKQMEGGEDTKHLLQELEEGMLRRAGHLFRAGKEMALWEYQGEENTSELVEAYKGVAKMQDTLARIGSAKNMSIKRVPEREQGDASMKTFYFNITDEQTNEQLEFKASIRPKATERGEARINFELILNKLPEESPLNQAFMQTTNFSGTGGRKRTVTGSVVRFGFDLDTKTNPPQFSFDMGRNRYADESIDRTGDVLGNILDKVAPTGHHLQEFNSKFSNPEVFAKIADSFISYFEQVPLSTSGEGV